LLNLENQLQDKENKLEIYKLKREIQLERDLKELKDRYNELLGKELDTSLRIKEKAIDLSKKQKRRIY
jgi:hypothetical protein